MKRKLTSLGLAIVILVAMVAVVSAAPGGTGTIVRWEQTGPTTAEIRVDGIANGLPAGGISYDIYMRVPDGVPMPTVSVASVGPAWAGLNCGFSASFYPQPSSGPPPGSGDHGLLLIGSCTSGVAQGTVTGDNVLLASVDLSSCPQGGFTMDLDSGDDVYGDSLSDIVGTSTAYFFTDQEMIDGPACGAPTAVELTNVQAESAPTSSVQYGALLAVAAIAAVVAGAGFAMRRRNSVNS